MSAQSEQFTPTVAPASNGNAPTKPPAGVTPADQTRVKITTDDNAHSQTDITGKDVTFSSNASSNTAVTGSWRTEEDARVREMIHEVVDARERRENTRANHRNFNRMMTLLGALVISIIVTWLLNYDHSLPTWVHAWAPFSFAITIALDSSLTIYAFIRHY